MSWLKRRLKAFKAGLLFSNAIDRSQAGNDEEALSILSVIEGMGPLTYRMKLFKAGALCRLHKFDECISHLNDTWVILEKEEINKDEKNYLLRYTWEMYKFISDGVGGGFEKNISIKEVKKNSYEYDNVYSGTRKLFPLLSGR